AWARRDVGCHQARLSGARHGSPRGASRRRPTCGTSVWQTVRCSQSLARPVGLVKAFREVFDRRAPAESDEARAGGCPAGKPPVCLPPRVKQTQAIQTGSMANSDHTAARPGIALWQNVAQLGGAKVVNSGMGFLWTVVLARSLGVREFGE